MRRFTRLAAEWWAVLVIAALLMAGAVAFDLTSRLDYDLHDLIQRHDEQPIDPRILIVAVDDRSLGEVGAWPWPRATTARLIDQLAAGSPKAIALDLMLLQPTVVDDDRQLAEAISRAGNVHLPVHFEVPGRNGAPFTLVEPYAPLARAAAGLGHVNLRPDADGTVRRIHLRYRGAAQCWEQLVSALAGAAPPCPVRARLAGLIAENPVLINYAQGPGGFPTISAASVLRGEVPGELLRDRLVIVGVNAAGLGDAYATPMGADGTLMPGIEIQANLLNALLTHQAMQVAGLGWRIIFALVPLLILHLTLRRFSPRAAPLAIAALAGAVLLASVVLMTHCHIWMPPVAPVLGLLGLYPLWTWRRLVAVSAQISTELETLDREKDPLEQSRPAIGGSDPLDRQLALLQSAIARGQNLRHFLIDRIAQMPDAVIVVDPEGRVVLANEGARQLHGQLRGASDALVHADDLLGAIHQAAAEGAKPIALADHIGPPASGRDLSGETPSGRSFDIRFEPQYSHAGALVGHDIRIADTTAATVMRRQRENILQLLSHDMRSPQASIITLLDQLDSGGATLESLPRIRRYAQRTLRLADDFVHLSRAELMPMAPVLLDLASLAQDAADQLWPLAHARHIAISVEDDTGRDELLVMGDASLLTRALVNLIDNAVKFSAERGRVWLRLAVKSGNGPAMAVAKVHDEGLGIAPEHQAVLFEKFRRAPSGPAHSIGGSGLGLAFVHTVAARHGGRITCESAPGKGTCFTLELPLAG